MPTRDGVLVNRHEPEIGGTTDVPRHPEFASRRTTKTIDHDDRLVHRGFHAGRGEGFDVDTMLVDVLTRNGLDQPGQKIFLESFETNLAALRRRLPNVPMVQLIDVRGGPAVPA